MFYEPALFLEMKILLCWREPLLFGMTSATRRRKEKANETMNEDKARDLDLL